MEKSDIIHMIGENLDIEGENMNKTIKIILVLLISILLIFSIPIYSNASGETEKSTLDTIISSGDSFLDDGNDSLAATPSESSLKKLSNTVSGILLTIAVAVTLISAAVMGINFVVQSVEDKAKIKESMVPWIIGIFISFGAYGIWRITMSIFYQFN